MSSLVEEIDDFSKSYQDAKVRGILTGLDNFITNYVDKLVAKDTGRLRAGLKAILYSAVNGYISGGANGPLTLTIPTFPDYALYHFDGTFGSSYKDPTTSGTEPILWEDFTRALFLALNEGLVEEFTLEGLQFTGALF